MYATTLLAQARCLLQRARSHGTVNLIVASNSPGGGSIELGSRGVVQRPGEASGGVVQRHGEVSGGVVQRHGEASGGVVQRPSNAILRNRSRCSKYHVWVSVALVG